MVREGRVFISPTGKPEYGIGYYVTAYEVGAQVASASSGITVTVRAGHGFAASDKLIVGTDATLYRRVISKTATTLVLDSAISLADGDLLVNLGQDTGSTAPNYDGNGLTIYTDMAYENVATNNTVLTDSFGKYEYFHPGIQRWELVRNSVGLPIAVYQDDIYISWATVDVRSFGAKGDGVTDDSVAIQSAIDFVSSARSTAKGGTVFFPSGNYAINQTIYLQPYVKLLGENYSGVAYIYSTNNAVTITAIATFSGTAMFATVAASQYWGIEINGFRIVGSDLVENIIVLDGTSDARLYNLSLSYCTKSAVWLVSGGVGIGQESRLYNVNCITSNTSIAAAYRGVIHVEHPDCVIHNCRAGSPSVSTYTSAGKRCGFYIGSTGNRISDSFADFNEDGWVVDWYGNQFSNCRADLNLGHGWNITSAGYSGTAVGCYAANNSQTATNTYDGFHVDAARFSLAGCMVVFNGVTNTHKYAFSQGAAFGTDNRFVGCFAEPAAYGTALFYDPNRSGGWETQTSKLFQAADDATPSVKNVRLLEAGGANTVPTAITQLDDGIPMQRVVIFCASNTTYPTIANGGNFQLSSGDWSPRYGDMIELILLGSTWFEVSRSAVDMATIGRSGLTTLFPGVVSIAGGIPRNVGTWPVNSATAGTDTSCSNGTAYTGSIFVPANMTVTGVQYLVGSVGGTDKVIASLHNSAGTLLANSALTGATVGTAAQVQQVAFTGTYAAVGPAWYHLALTFNGTTAKFRTIPAFCNAGSGVVGNGVTQTFGTAATFTAPTTFTADKVPVASIY